MITLEQIISGSVSRIWLPYPTVSRGYPEELNFKGLHTVPDVLSWKHNTTKMKKLTPALIANFGRVLVFPLAGLSQAGLLRVGHSWTDSSTDAELDGLLTKPFMSVYAPDAPYAVIREAWPVGELFAPLHWTAAAQRNTHLAFASQEEFEAVYGHRFNFATGVWQSREQIEGMRRNDRHVFCWKNRFKAKKPTKTTTFVKVHVA